jgi:anaerobic magnesium-protoporphyrin IX monomethyl ester cyclase
MLTAYLREHGLDVEQRDLNIGLCHRLARRSAVERYLRSRPAPAGSLSDRYRLAMARFVRDRCEGLWETLGRPERTEDETVRALRFLNHTVNLLVEGSRLTPSPRSLADVDREALRDEPLAPADPARDLWSMVEELLDARRPRIVALSIPFFSQLVPALLVARWVRERAPGTTIALGGQQAMLWASRLTALESVRRSVDFIGTGKGEEALLRLHEHVTGGAPFAAPDLVAVRDPAERPTRRSALRLRDAPVADFHGLPLGRYLSAETELAMITCVGCSWGRCVFCSYGNRSHRDSSYEQATPEQLAGACESLIERHGIRRINFVDENTNLRLVLAAMRVLNERGERIRFSTRNRLEPRLLDVGFCRELHDRGCILMSCGYETNSQRLLDKLDKGLDASTFQRIIDNLHEVGIVLRLSVMGGIPSETPEEAAASRAFLRRNQDKIGIDVMQMLVAEPGTYLADEPERYGVALADDGALRGNELLSYAHGRMGTAFAYLDGSSFEERLAGFVDVYREVSPQKSDELPPHRRTAAGAAECALDRVRLHPWVRVFAADRPSADGELLVDLLWQRFVTLPSRVRSRRDADGRCVLTAATQDLADADAQRLLREIVHSDLGELANA